MRRNLLAAVALILAGLACQLPNPGNIKGTIGGIQKTVVTGITEIPGTIKAGVTELSASPASTATGILRGHLSYPSESIPPLRVVAFSIVSLTPPPQVTTVPGQSEYKLVVPPGEYQVVAYTLDGKLSAGYTKAVPCGLLASCTDHTLISVRVDSGAVVETIDPTDWYAPKGAFPPMP